MLGSDLRSQIANGLERGEVFGFFRLGKSIGRNSVILDSSLRDFGFEIFQRLFDPAVVLGVIAVGFEKIFRIVQQQDVDLTRGPVAAASA